MPNVARLLDRQLISNRLRRDPHVHLYELGDLDDFFFGSCDYWGDPKSGPIALLYRASDPPTLLALARRSSPELEAMVRDLAPSLPAICYAHLAPGLASSLRGSFDIELHGQHAKLALPAGRAAHLHDIPNTATCVRVSPADLDGVLELYRESYPGSWFAPRMLETGAYFGIREGSRWIAIAGVHVLSSSQRVASLGNVTSHPAYRGRGLARAVCARVCAELATSVDEIGLNVAADNAAALACYRALGFEHVSFYDEATLRSRTLSESARPRA